MTEEKEKTLFGFPVIVSDQIPAETAVLGRWPTEEEVKEHGSFEKAVEAQAKEWAIIKGISLK